MRSRNIAQGVDHCQHYEPERQTDADVGHRAAGDIVDDNSSRSGEHQGERAKEFAASLFIEWFAVNSTASS